MLFVVGVLYLPLHFIIIIIVDVAVIIVLLLLLLLLLLFCHPMIKPGKSKRVKNEKIAF